MRARSLTPWPLLLLLAGLAVTASACDNAPPGPPPPFATLDPLPASETVAPPKPQPRVVAVFVDHASKHVDAKACDEVFVGSARGQTTALGETLAEGDALFVVGAEPFDVVAGDLALVGTVAVPCTAAEHPLLRKGVARKAEVAELWWARGAMGAQLFFEKEQAYFGRLEGTAPVAPHDHAASWEVLSVIEGAGVFTVDGRPVRVEPRSIVFVPPATKHSWQPDPGSKLVAFQIYDPPGPEQRFKGLAATGAEAGAPEAGALEAGTAQAGR
jgi:mannose-6-phosphate isomerase-like protein (cupin superfamily)